MLNDGEFAQQLKWRITLSTKTKGIFVMEALTSFWNIFISPELILIHVSTALMLHNWFECSEKLPVFTLKSKKKEKHTNGDTS